MLTFRLAVVHSLPSAIRLEEAIVPDRFGLSLNAASSRRRQQIPTQYSARLPRHNSTRRHVVLAAMVWSRSVSSHL